VLDGDDVTVGMQPGDDIAAVVGHEQRNFDVRSRQCSRDAFAQLVEPLAGARGHRDRVRFRGGEPPQERGIGDVGFVDDDDLGHVERVDLAEDLADGRELRREIAGMKTAREVKRQERRRRSVPSVVIAGYTNAGKSSLLNRLTGAGVLVENALFATLDPTVRRTETPDGRVYTLADTVGFVRSLPHQLVEAFRSTLEEVAQADLVLHVVDGSHPDPAGQLAAVREVFGEIGALDVPELVVVNKADIADPSVLRQLRAETGVVAVSARTGEGIEALRSRVAELIPRPDVEVRLLVPYDRGDVVARLHEHGEVFTVEHVATGTRIEARVPEWLAAEVDVFAVAETG
jgi:GTP-binding protein HflX